MPGETTAGARSVPCDDAISTTSPSAIPSFAAVAVLISTQLLHIADVIGSGISCSHGRCASDPSRKADDGYGRKWSGYCAASPSNSGGANKTAFVAEGAEAAGVTRGAGNVPHQPPFSCASVHASLPSVIAGSAMNVAVSISSNVIQGRFSGRASFCEISISTSGMARVSCNGFIAADTAPTTAVNDPDSGRASANDSRNV